MKSIGLTLLVLFAASAQASDLHVQVKSGGQSVVKVSPGATVNYSVLGELSDAANEGLAMFALDLSFTGGPLLQADAPSSGTMTNFAAPLGLNNPAGFGGTVSRGVLRQVGGAQNTINNLLAPMPIGNVLTGVAQPGSPATLVTGSLVAPTTVGSYTLAVGNLFANTIRQGETGFPFWRVEAANPGTVTALTVVVEALTADVDTLSISAPGTQTLSLNAGVANAGRIYWLLGSVTGASPGIQVNPFTLIPLNYDVYMQYTISHPNTALLSNSLATLDGQGKATATFNLPPGLSGSFLGVTAHHAFALVVPINYASNAVSVTLVP